MSKEKIHIIIWSLILLISAAGLFLYINRANIFGGSSEQAAVVKELEGHPLIGRWHLVHAVNISRDGWEHWASSNSYIGFEFRDNGTMLFLHWDNAVGRFFTEGEEPILPWSLDEDYIIVNDGPWHTFEVSDEYLTLFDFILFSGGSQNVTGDAIFIKADMVDES